MAFRVLQQFVIHQTRTGVKLSEKETDVDAPILGVYWPGYTYRHTTINKPAADEAIEKGWATLEG